MNIVDLLKHQDEHKVIADVSKPIEELVDFLKSPKLVDSGRLSPTFSCIKHLRSLSLVLLHRPCHESHLTC